MQPRIDVEELRGKVREMYGQVADDPTAELHFETGRALAVRLGYPEHELERVPAEAVDSFAGVGYHLDLADLAPGDQVLDLGSGSGMDSFVAALRVGSTGQVQGIDMTDAQRRKAMRLAERDGFDQVAFADGLIEDLPAVDDCCDVVLSNGVINLAADKDAVFREIARVLRPGGKMAISDIVTEKPLTENIVCDTSLWAACIGGAAQVDAYRASIAAAGLTIVRLRENPDYAFLSKSAQGATEEFGVKSVSLVAVLEA
jgi:arsenite methyltransferase